MKTNLGASKVAIIIVLALLSLAGVSVAFYLSTRTPASGASSKEGSTAGKEDALLDTPLPISWAEHEPSETIEVELQANGPVLRVGSLEWSPTPTLEGLEDLSWKTSREGSRTQITGRGQWNGKPAMLRWIIEEKDPQISLTIELTSVDINQLATPIKATLALPGDGGELWRVRSDFQRDAIRNRRMLDAWSPQWLQWRSDDRTLSFTGWNADRVHVDPEEHALDFSLWHPAHHPPLSGCGDLDAVTLRYRLEVTIGDRLDLVTSRLPSGHQAALAPLFIAATDHPDATLKEGTPKDALDWSARVQTLLYGHSFEEDPRFGNGGLLGIELGGGVTVPAAWYEEKAVKSLRDRTDETRARIIPRGEVKGAAISMTPELGCASFAGKNNAQVYLGLGTMHPSSAPINALLPSTAMVIGDEQVQTSLPGFVDGRPAHLELPLLSGSRRALTDGYFSREKLHKLLTERGIAWFATPLVATRNPLVGASREALLEPERQGHWTLAPNLARALGNVELINEDGRLLVTHPGELLNHWRATRRVQLRELADGSYALLNPGPPIKGFTLIAPGDITPSIGEDGAAPLGREVLSPRDGETQTWFWWDLKEGVTHLRFGAGDASESPLQPVLWNIQD